MNNTSGWQWEFEPQIHAGWWRKQGRQRAEKPRISNLKFKFKIRLVGVETKEGHWYWHQWFKFVIWIQILEEPINTYQVTWGKTNGSRLWNLNFQSGIQNLKPPAKVKQFTWRARGGRSFGIWFKTCDSNFGRNQPNKASPRLEAVLPMIQHPASIPSGHPTKPC